MEAGPAVTSKPIDVWDVETFDPALTALLRSGAELVRDYMVTDHRIFLAHDLGRGSQPRGIRPENPYASRFLSLREAIGREMQSRTIRAFHYTRLTDAEVALLRRDGVHLSTPVTLRTRLTALVAAGHLTAETADMLYAASPFHSDQLAGRSDRFSMTSHPLAIDDGGVTPLLAHWGGEVASMWVEDPALLAPLAAAGEPRIIELAVPMELTSRSHVAGEAVIAAFGRSLGCIPGKHAFDLYTSEPLKAEAILAVHSKGDASFVTMGRGYPQGFVDVDVGRWKELTGEET